ncbi:CACTA en-spm transposon protein [Cucumis melo var. makuwa]|uniref:CACTA en-spm transposon protein n=1 Tax=Cucumis melo var. makuwa TaxID=1194695 RepID=A0A5A7TYD4_CUCMM|nr:CACTA en-spm transposon protein [Cucumis melo var. makuwa]TYK28345.1 CACTA en-spm transposon protein [Cucumis melo var. makuwa]
MWMNTCHMQGEQATMTNDNDEPRTMSSFRRDFDETNAMFLEFAEDLDNLVGGLSSVGDNSTCIFQSSASPTPRRRAQSQLFELERYIAANGDPSLRLHKTISTNSSMTSCLQSTVQLQLQAKLDQANQRIEEQTRNYDALVLEVEQLQKLIEDMNRTQQGQPHDP